MIIVKVSYFSPDFATEPLEHFYHVAVKQGNEVISDFPGSKTGFLTDVIIGFHINQVFQNLLLTLSDVCHGYSSLISP